MVSMIIIVGAGKVGSADKVNWLNKKHKSFLIKSQMFVSDSSFFNSSFKQRHTNHQRNNA
jgi:hypothetical protein